MFLVPIDRMFGTRGRGDASGRPGIGDAININGRKFYITNPGMKYVYAVPESTWLSQQDKPARLREYNVGMMFQRVTDVRPWVDAAPEQSPIPELTNLGDPSVSPIANGNVGNEALRAAMMRDLEERMSHMDLRAADPDGADELRSKIAADLQGRLVNPTAAQSIAPTVATPDLPGSVAAVTKPVGHVLSDEDAARLRARREEQQRLDSEPLPVPVTSVKTEPAKVKRRPAAKKKKASKKRTSAKKKTIPLKVNNVREETQNAPTTISEQE